MNLSTRSHPARRPAAAAVVVLAIAVLLGCLGYAALAPSSSAASSFDLRSIARGAQDDGRVRGDATVFDDGAAVTRLDRDLLAALRAAATDAADDGVEVLVTSGWRSPTYQDELLREAIRTYGSREEAARWVATPSTSPHVSGDAVDVGPTDAMSWLSQHGSAYGLCQIYGNEPWHYELRPEAVGHACPPPYADPTHDPRMRR